MMMIFMIIICVLFNIDIEFSKKKD